MNADCFMEEDVREKEHTFDVSPGPFGLQIFTCGLARGRAVGEEGEENGDVDVDRMHIKFCAKLREPFKRDPEEKHDEVNEVQENF